MVTAPSPAPKPSPAPRSASEVEIKHTECFIDGKWVPAVSGKTFATMNPATEQEIAQIAEGIAQDPGARMPGQGKQPQDPVQLEDGIWDLTQSLAAA